MQNTDTILMIRPSNFGFNTETAESNAFQNTIEGDEQDIQAQVAKEFEAFTKQLLSNGIQLEVFDDTSEPPKPDAVFPNNWVSFHADGRVVLYPMYAPIRRLERRKDIIEQLKVKYKIREVLDLSNYEERNIFLEGTGSIIFDHDNRIAYACLSPRTDKHLFVSICNYLKYKPLHFIASDVNHQEIYHTNVMMCVGKDIAVICLESIKEEEERQRIMDSLIQTGHEIVDISLAQMEQFAGNMLEIKGTNNQRFLAMSQRACDSLTETQKAKIEKHCSILPLSIPTIETIGGGSARCMMAEVFLEKR